jgi:ribosome maturation factor RimP
MNQALQDVVVAELDSLGFDLVEIRRGGTRTRPVLDVRIDRRDGEKVTVDDCARASRAIEARLDAGAVFAGKYVLEVSSPGVERPLRTPNDWQRFVGRRARLTSTAVASVGGVVEGEIVGLEHDAGNAVAVVRDDKGVTHRAALDAIREARLVFHWKV